MPGIGDNINGQLQSIVDRIERMEREKAEIAEGIKDIYQEARGHGFDTKTLRKVIAMRKKDPAERAEEAAMLDVYMKAPGDLADTPLGKAAVAAEFG